MLYQALARHLVELLIIAGSIGFIEVPSAIAQPSGEEAPAFTLESVYGKSYSLDQFRGNYVILEWMNFRCRIVDALYKGRKMPALQEEMAAQDVIWLSIVSEAEGKQGQVSAEKMKQQLEKRGGKQHAVLIDDSGVVGRMYGAVVSPHIVVVNPEGQIIYQGALDNQPEGQPVEGRGGPELCETCHAAIMERRGGAIRCDRSLRVSHQISTMRVRYQQAGLI